MDEEAPSSSHELPAALPAEALHRTVLDAGFEAPIEDLSELLGRLGTMLFPSEPTLCNYVGWSHEAGLFDLLERIGSATIAEVSAGTPLTEAGADALLGVLCALGLATRSPTGQYALSRTSRIYCLRSSPYLIADQLSSPTSPLARTLFVKMIAARARPSPQRVWQAHPAHRFGTMERLRNQHARNLSACAAAVRTGEFANIRCLLDLAGGGGTFAIPFALEYSQSRALLAELPEALENIRAILVEHALEDRIELIGLDAFRTPWPVPECDGVFIGNFLHGFADEAGNSILREAYRCLPSGGRVWLHEVIWNPNRDGPLITALLHAGMRGVGQGRQRTFKELAQMLESVGFVKPYGVPTNGAFTLIAAKKA